MDKTPSPSLIAKSLEVQQLLASCHSLTTEEQKDEYKKNVQRISQLIGDTGVSKKSSLIMKSSLIWTRLPSKCSASACLATNQHSLSMPRMPVVRYLSRDSFMGVRYLGCTMTVVLIDLWENERRVSSPVKSHGRELCHAHKPRKFALKVSQKKCDRSFAGN
jgi:hypothetical protein